MSKMTYVGPHPQLSAEQHLATSKSYEQLARIRAQVAKLYLDCRDGDEEIEEQAERLIREALADRTSARYHSKLAKAAQL